MDRPPDVTMSADGFYYQAVAGSTYRVCEDCWEPIPRYIDFPQGLTSPESDGDQGGNFAKSRPMGVEGKPGREALRKAVCLSCYQEAFQRFYPGAELPDLRADVMAPSQPYAPEPEAPLEHVLAPEGL